jgi:hypothetical protein
MVSPSRTSTSAPSARLTILCRSVPLRLERTIRSNLWQWSTISASCGDAEYALTQARRRSPHVLKSLVSILLIFSTVERLLIDEDSRREVRFSMATVPGFGRRRERSFMRPWPEVAMCMCPAQANGFTRSALATMWAGWASRSPRSRSPVWQLSRPAHRPARGPRS